MNTVDFSSFRERKRGLLVIEFEKDHPQDYMKDKDLIGLHGDELKKALDKPFYVSEDLKVEIDYYVKKTETWKEYHFTIPKGYDWNGANVPPGFWLLIGQQKEPRFKVASCVHDYLCEHHDVIDNDRYLSTFIFESLCKECGGFNSLKCWAMFHSVDNYQKLCRWGKKN